MNPPTLDDTEIVKSLFQKPKSLKLSELAILGLLSHTRLSGYDIYKRFDRKIDWIGSYLNFNKATVYNTLTRMEKKGLIRVDEKIEEEKKPPKYLYDLTDKGVERLKDMLVSDSKNFPFMLSNTYYDLFFYHVFDREEIKGFLEHRVKQIKFLIEIYKAYLIYNEGNIFGFIYGSELRTYEDTLDTLTKLLKAIEERTLDDLYDMKYVFDGEKPPEIYELFGVEG
jgi:DNA-binding PadR family transcriptional regulator